MPAAEGAPGVVVVHDWYGLLPHVRGVCDDLVAAGFSALAVDLYDGRWTTDEGEAEQLMDALSGDDARARIAQAVRTLRGSGVMAPRISALAYSMGGQLALDVARKGLFDSVVAFYASGSPADAPLPCPVQLHLADIVDFEPADLPQQFTAAVRAGGMPATDHTYPGTDHSFANADVGCYDAQATAKAWERTVEFLRG